MKIISSEFEVSATDLKSCPRLALPEVAFIGRSNVGKSSLINCLVSRNDLARVSDMPGKTRLMNFYVVNKNWRLVDLPGYGFAKVAKEDRAEFNEATAEFLQHRPNLKCTFVLLDSRHEPQAVDLSFLSWIEDAGVPHALVFTKADKQSKSRTQEAVARYLKSVFKDRTAPKHFITSSESGEGRKELIEFIAKQLASKH